MTFEDLATRDRLNGRRTTDAGRDEIARAARTQPRPPLVVLSVKPLADVWLVREAESSSGEVYHRKEDAIARASHILRRRGGGRLRILKRDGLLERELEMIPRR
jgi:hypothetical protein